MNRTMDNLEQLSDSELRHRLLQYGFPNLPVTDTTRNILIKKLRNHMNSEKSKLRRETKYATRYSSDEESDIDARKRKNRTFPSPPRAPSYNNMPPPSSPVVSRRITTSTTNRSVINDIRPQEKSIRNSIYVPPPSLATDTDEDSDYVSYNQNSSITSRLSSSPTIQLSTSPTLLSRSNYAYTPDTTLDDSSSLLRNRYSYPYISKLGTDITPTTNGHHTNKDSSYLSDYTNKLLNLRGETIRDSVYNTSPNRYTRFSRLHPDPADIVHQQSEPRSDINISPSTAFSNLINRLDEQYGVKQTLIPCVLLSALIVFFILVTFMYMTISPDLANTISEKNTFYRICDGDSHTSALATSTYNCIEDGNVDDALGLLRLMAPELQKRIEHHNCKDSSAPSTMSAKEIVRLVQNTDPHINVRRTIRNMHNLEYLIQNNPHWKINLVDSNGKALDFDEVMDLRDTQAYHFAILNPRLPFTCTLYNKLQKFFLYVGGLGLVLLGASAFYFLYKFCVNYQQSKRDAVSNIVDEIINHLIIKAACDPDQSSVVVNHLRDKLIPLHKRRQLEWAWNESIKFLEQNDSRIQFELGIRNGEDCKLMKWVDTVLPDQIVSRSHVKKWQSPAFDKTNKITNPPTPCLKIRNMFEKHEANNPELKTAIQDAILEKVGSGCKIYDIQLDKVNCWVYVRCATVQDAGIVHDKINGWWLDKKLVSIKFLRMERYLSRFSDSLSGPTCLRPSNTKNLSMSQCERKDVRSMNVFEDDDMDDDDIDDD